MLKMVDGTGIIGLDMVCPLGGTAPLPQPPNFDKIEMEGVGSLVLPNSLKAPLERLELIGNSVQGENPSPDNPQEIRSVGKFDEASGKYLLDVKITGKNLFNAEKARDIANWIVRENDGYAKFPIHVGKGNKVTFSYTEKLTTGKGFYLGIAQSERSSVVAWLYHSSVLSVSNNKYTVVAAGDYIYLSCNKSGIQKFVDTIQTLQAEISDGQNPYEPYTEQSLTLTSDRPITKWDKLVEQGGEYGWLYGGKIIDSYNSEPIDTEYMSSTGQLSIGATVLYRLKESEFIPLSESEQTQLRNLHSYNGTTHITVDSGEVPCGIKLTYRKEK